MKKITLLLAVCALTACDKQTLPKHLICNSHPSEQQEFNAKEQYDVIIKEQKNEVIAIIDGESFVMTKKTSSNGDVFYYHSDPWYNLMISNDSQMYRKYNLGIPLDDTNAAHYIPCDIVE